MNLQDPAPQSLRPIGRLALTSMLPGEVFASRGKQEELKPCLTPSPLTSGNNNIHSPRLVCNQTRRASRGQSKPSLRVAGYWPVLFKNRSVPLLVQIPCSRVQIPCSF